MTGLTRSVNYRPMQGPVTSMADSEKNGGLPNGAEVVSKFTDPTGSENEHRCRWGSCSPACCQTFRRAAWFLFCLCWAGAIQGMVVNGFINVVISTVERRFEISSTESGTIASCYDIAAVLCLIPVSYFGSRGCKPVYLAVGMMVMALGSFVFSLPHFTTSLYQMESAKHALCTAKDNVTNCDATSSTELSNYKFVFFLGQLLHGAGASPLYTLGTTYLDDNLPVKSASLYQGIFYACAIFGPGIGYLAGGAFLNFYTDFDQIDKSSLSINKDNPRWVGAWWIGFLISSFAAFVISLPLFGFPKSLPGCEQYIAEKEKEVYSGGASGKAIEKEALGMRHILTSVRMLLSNPTFMFLNLAAACEGAVLSGFSTFAPKFIEFQFSLTSDVSAQYIGMLAIPCGGGGTFLGGWLIKRFNLDIRRILKFCGIVTIFAVCVGFVFLVHCTNVPFAGISIDYQQLGRSGESLGSLQLDATCNSGCGCSLLHYSPVCGRDNVMYYSPCYAGCLTAFPAHSEKYSNCSCVRYNFTAEDISKSQYWQAAEGKCENGCPHLPIFLPLFGFALISIFITSMPALSASLRCVTHDQRSFALGIQWIIARCLGSIPGPILFGKVIDLTCVMWQKNCQGDGTCFYYDNKRMSHNLLALATAFNSLSCVSFFLALLFYKTKPNSTTPKNTTALDDMTPSSLHTSMTTFTQPPTPNSEHSVDGFPVLTSFAYTAPPKPNKNSVDENLS